MVNYNEHRTLHNQGNNVNPNTPETPTPIETTPTEAIPTAPLAVTPPVSPVTPLNPPANDTPMAIEKKPRKKLLIGLIITAAVLIIGALTAFLIVSNLTNQAKDAASSYRKALDIHLAAVLDVTNIKDRLDLYPKKPSLEKVAQGEALSKEYKEAIALQTRYNKMLDDSYSTVAERYATLDLKPWLTDLVAALDNSLDTSIVDVTDEASLATAKENVKNIETKSTNLSNLAKRLRSYVYAEKYREYQTKSADALEGMAKSRTELAKLVTESNDLSAKLLESQKTGNTEATEKLAAEVRSAKISNGFKSPTIARDYQAFAATVNTNNQKLVQTISADGYGLTVYNRSSDAVDALLAFQKEIKK